MGNASDGPASGEGSREALSGRLPRALLDQALFGCAADHQPRTVVAWMNGDCHDRRVKVPESCTDQADHLTGRVRCARLGADHRAFIRKHLLNSLGGSVRRHADVEVDFQHVLSKPAGCEIGRTAANSDNRANLNMGTDEKLVLVRDHFASQSNLGSREAANIRPCSYGIGQ
jgi:hypothetical protein